jgi:hypothetical protein
VRGGNITAPNDNTPTTTSQPPPPPTIFTPTTPSTPQPPPPQNNNTTSNDNTNGYQRMLFAPKPLWLPAVGSATIFTPSTPPPPPKRTRVLSDFQHDGSGNITAPNYNTPQPPTMNPDRTNKIRQAAQQIFSGSGDYRSVCIRMGLNLDTKGKYLESVGADYKQIQKTVRKLRRQATNRMIGKSKRGRYQQVLPCYATHVTVIC